MDFSQLEDGELLQQIKLAQTKALDELYGRYGRLVYSVALRVVGEQGAAEEVALDTFMTVWQKAGSYRADRGSVRVWLTSMARNRAIDILRRQKTMMNYQQKFWAEMVVGTDGLERSPESKVVLRSRQEMVRRAINELPEEHRDLLALAYFQGLTQSQIAHLRDIPLGTVKTRIRAGMQKLRQILEEEHAEY